MMASNAAGRQQDGDGGFHEMNGTKLRRKRCIEQGSSAQSPSWEVS